MPSVRFRYQTVEIDGVYFQLRALRDRQQFGDDSGQAEALGVPPSSWPLFGVLWDSSRVLAQLMAAHDVAGLRILEVGCGLGLVSQVLNNRQADITASDHNPEAGEFLAYNTALNDAAPIRFVRAGWADETSELGEYDLVVGSDVLYEPHHVDALSEFIDRHAARRCEVILVDPGRPQRGPFSRRMADLGFTQERRVVEGADGVADGFRATVLTFTRGMTPEA